MVEPKIKIKTVKDHNLTDQELEKAKKFIQEKNPPKKEKIVSSEMTTAKEEIVSTAKEAVEVQSAPVESKKKSKKKK